MAQTPEGRVKAMVKKRLDGLKDDCYRFMPVQSGFGAQTLDYLNCIRGHFVAIETKAPGKKLTPMQNATKERIEKAGGIVLVIWDEASLDRAMFIIKTLEQTNVIGLARALSKWTNSDYTEETPGYQEYLRAQQQRQASDPTAGGDHGAPRTQPE